MANDSNVIVTLKLLGATGFSAEAKRAERALKDINGQTKRTSKSTNDFNRSMTAARNVLKLVKPAALITSVGLLSESLAAGGAGAVALAAGLAPAAGAIAAYPAVASAAAQGLGAFKLGLAGVSDALGGLHSKLDPKKLKALTPPARAFARTLQRLKPDVIAIQRGVQAGMFPGLTKGLRSAAGNLGVVRRGMAATGKVIGQLAAHAGRLVGSKGFGRDLQTQMSRNNVTIRRLGGAGLHLGDALRHVVLAAGPLVNWMTKLIGRFARGADNAARLGRHSGKLAAFFEKTRRVMSRLISIATSVGRALFNIGKAGQSLGGDLLRSISRVAKRFADWTASMRGQNAIKHWFSEARAPLHELGKLVIDVVRDFGKLGGGASGLAPMIKQIRTELLPILVRVTRNTTKAFGPTLISAITNIAQAMEPLMGTSGPLVLYVKTLSGLAKASAWLTRTIPGAGSAITFFVGAMAVGKVTGFIGALRGLRAMTMAMRISYLVSTGALTANTSAEVANAMAKKVSILTVVRERVATLASAAASKIAAGATKVMAAGQWLLNAALTANPIGLVVVAIGALVAGFVLAYKKSATFRSIVHAVGKALKVYLTPAIWAVKTAIHSVLAIADKLGPVFKKVPHILKGAFSGIAGFVGGVFTKVLDVIRGAINGLIDIVNAAIKAYNKIPLAPNISTIGKIGAVAKKPAVSGPGTGSGLIGGINNAVNGGAGSRGDAAQRGTRSYRPAGTGAALQPSARDLILHNVIQLGRDGRRVLHEEVVRHERVVLATH